MSAVDISPTLRDRFAASILPRPSGCVEWTGVTSNSGYGMISIATGVSRSTHRVSWFLHYGRWPEKALLHSCDNRLCVNIEHLREGTKGDNNRDTAAKRRFHYGTDHHNGKLSDAQVVELRRRRDAGETLWALADYFGVSQALVSQIARGKARRTEAIDISRVSV